MNNNENVDSPYTSEAVLEIDIRRLLDIAWKYAVEIICVVIIFASAAFMYSELFITPLYTANVSLYVKNNRQTNYTANAVNDINASQMLASSYCVILSDDVVLDSVGKKLEDKYSIEDLAKYIGVTVNEQGETHVSSPAIAATLSMSTVNDTEILSISCTNPSAEIASDICNYLADVAPQSMSEIIGTSYVSPIGYANVPSSKSYPNTLGNVGIAAVIGLVLACGVVFIKSYGFGKLTSADSITSAFGLPVLGEIPEYKLS
jgi:capsular polysaccharide biosynthesis protein